MNYFNCSTCRQKFNTFMWCDSCQKQEFENNFKNWTSENDEIDSFIQQTQLKAIDFDQFIQWMPFEGFDILGKVGQGGFATVYEAIWCDGPIWNWNVKSRKWERNDSCRVALKVLEDSKGSTEFLKEISAYVECAALSVLKQTILRCYGISQDPETQDFIMVLEYMPYGNIHLLEAKCDWSTRITILKDILHGLLTIHKKGLIHRDLHAGNILMRNNLSGQESKIAITDIGQNGPPYHTFGTDLYGVMPYISPEVLRGNAYTQSSDIYSLGMIMYELISGVPPFSNRAHDQTLMLDICNGVRPEIKNIDKFPDDFIKILRRCWDPNPFNRPSAHELFLFDNYGELDVKDEKLFKFEHEYELHPGAVYISRDLSIYAQYLSQDEVVEIEWSKGKKLEVYESSCTTKLQNMNDEFGNHFTF